MGDLRRRVLYVEDDSLVLSATRNLMRRHREWELSYAASGAEALEQLEHHSFDVVVTDLRMPGMDGAELLAKVREKWPAAMRVIVSGGSDNATVMRTLPVAHQFLSKPYEVEDLISLVERSSRLRARLESPSMRALAGQLDKLPSVPQTYLELTQAAASARSSAQDFARIIERDPAMAAKVLQLVNSAYFGLPQRIASVNQAVAYLGVELLKGLALTARIFSATQAAPKGFSVDRLQEQSLLTARLAKKFVSGKQSETAFTAGLMHAVGQLVFAQCLPAQLGQAFEQARAQNRPLEDVERELLGVDHAGSGAFLLGSWGLPFKIVEAVAFHLQPGEVAEDGCLELAAVYVASQYARALGSRVALPADVQLDLKFLERAGARSLLSQWRAAAEQIAL